jgi:hypothetical protein
LILHILHTSSILLPYLLFTLEIETSHRQKCIGGKKMKKTITITIVGLLVLGFAVTMVSAATTNTPANFPPWARYQGLTETQQQELAPLFNQMNDLRKQMFDVQKQVIQKQVEFGNLTQEQANQRIDWMKQRQENGFGPGMMGRGPGGGRGPGMMRGGPGAGPGYGPMWQQPPANK